MRIQETERLSLLVMAAVFVMAACGAERPSAATDTTRVPATTRPAERPTCTGAPVDLVDERYPGAVAGDSDFGYHKTASQDLDGDGTAEHVHVIARAVKSGDGYEWDDGSAWHVYVDGPAGERTYLFSGWVQLGTLDVSFISRDEPGADVLIQDEEGAGYRLFCGEYHGPGRIRTTTVAEFAVSGRVR